MRKKTIIITSIFLFLISGYLLYNQLNPTCIALHVDRDYHQSINELENTSDLIVEIQATSVTKTHYEIFNNNLPEYGWTNRNVNIISVYKSPEGFSEKTLIIREAYWQYTNPIGKKIEMFVGDYRPMKPNKTYILFLVKNDDGTYQPNYTEQGKYLIDNTLMTSESLNQYNSEDFEIGAETPNYSYKNFYKEVIKKYKITSLK